MTTLPGDGKPAVPFETELIERFRAALDALETSQTKEEFDLRAMVVRSLAKDFDDNGLGALGSVIVLARDDDLMKQLGLDK